MEDGCEESAPPQSKPICGVAKQMRLLRQVVKGIVKAVAMVTAFVFFFDNRVTSTAGVILICSVVILAACGVAWMVLDHYWPDDEAGTESQE